MPEEAGFPPAKRFRPGSGPASRAGSFPPGRQVVMLLTAGSGGRGGGGGRRQQPPLAQPSASPYPEAVELQRRSLPIFQARGQLLAQLRNLDNAVLIGSPFFTGHPGVPHWAGGDRSHEQDVPRHCKAPPRWLPCDAGPSSIRLPALCTAAPSLPRGPKDSGLEVLAVQRVSKTQAWQRTGRAGREDSGICYRLYTEDEFEKFDKMTMPEIQRCNLASVMLQLLAMKVPNVLTFDFMSKPSPDHIQAAIAQLDLLGALEHKDDQLTLTPMGRKMAAFPLEPKFAKTILMSPKFHCTEEILTIVSLLSVDSVLHNPPSRREEVQGVRKKFISSEGDHMTLLNIYRTFRNLGGNKDWCKENFVNSKNMMLVAEVRAQLRDICLKMSMPIASSRGDVESVRRCLAHSLFMSTAELQPDGTYATTDTHQPVAIHPSSVLFHCKPACVVYTELLYTNKCYMRDLCVVDAQWLYEAAPEHFRRKLRTARN
uniref:RNA helicase n=1 Tax=Gorilla gorilla gorilla TaxID=9595 RepID=G3QJV5_GORGO